MKIISKPTVGQFVGKRLVERRLTWEVLQEPLGLEGHEAVLKVLQGKAHIPYKLVPRVARVLQLNPLDLMTVVLANRAPGLLLVLDYLTDGLFLSGDNRVVVDLSEYDIVRKIRSKK